MIKLDTKKRTLYVETEDDEFEYDIPREDLEQKARESFINKEFPKMTDAEQRTAERVLEKYIEDYSDIDELIEEFEDEIAVELWEERKKEAYNERQKRYAV